MNAILCFCLLFCKLYIGYAIISFTYQNTFSNHLDNNYNTILKQANRKILCDFNCIKTLSVTVQTKNTAIKKVTILSVT